MGFQVRRRTKGKKGWLNFSGSGVSASVKLTPNITMNLGSRGTRTTVNLGGGMRYVSTNSKKKKATPKKTTAKAKTPRVNDPRSFWEILCGKTIEEKNQELLKVPDAVKQIELTIENEKALNEVFIGKANVQSEEKPIEKKPVIAKLEPLPEVKEIQEIVSSTFTVDPSLLESPIESKSTEKPSTLALILSVPFLALGWLIKTLFVLLFFGIKWGIVGFVLYTIVGWLMTIKVTDV